MANYYEYRVKRLDAKRVAVSKWDSTGDIEQVYTIEDHNCECPGAMYHRIQCKHLKIREAWLGMGEPYGFFTVNKKGVVLFHPEQVQGA